jgi:uncharacterized protein (DUF58 family)
VDKHSGTSQAQAAAGSSFDPALLDRLEGLALVARTVVEGFMAGHHRSPLRGSSAEFAQHREYVVGDEPRRLDWKVFARSDRLVVKEFFEETTLDCHLLVDASESMGFASLEWSKLDYARWCAAALAHLIVGSRDTVGLVVFDERERVKVPPGNGAPQLAVVLQALEGARAQGKTGVAGVLDWLCGRLKRRGLVVVFSDFFEDPRAVARGITRLAHAGHEPILFQVVDPLEKSLAIEHLVRFDGLESLGHKRLDPRAIRAAYQQEFAAHTQALAETARASGLDFEQLETRTGVDVALRTYLTRRTARWRGGRR